MLSVSTMTLAAVLGSACGTNAANLNTCSPDMYQSSGCPQIVQYQNGGQQLDQLLNQMGVCMQNDNSSCRNPQMGDSQCGLRPECAGGNTSCSR